ncbi:MAG TPA: heme biosynthesis HemY N-terminal domain-containing protein [Alphaproteobacteria bacterium]|nr:heme biosynthesis HemY N-terminal domain-containing protein [Alphaproteobacteria bacterium]
MKAFFKTLWLIVKIAAMGALAIWIMQQQGDVAITLDQNGAPVIYEFALPVILSILVVGLLLLLSVMRLFDNAARMPGQIALKNERKKLQEGYQALTKSLVAIAAGDGHGAEKLAQQAAKKLGAPPLSLLVHAQAAQLQGDTGAASRFFHQLAADPKAGFLGLRGQLMQEMKIALTTGQVEHARRLAAEAETKEPRSPWVMQARFALEARAKNWREAEQVLVRGARFQAFTKDENKWYLAALQWMQSQEATTRDDARHLAKRAWETCPPLVPAAVHYAEILFAAGRRNSAADVIGKSWQSAPHPDLALMWMRLMPESDGDSIARVKWCDKLLLLNDRDPEAQILRARTLLDANLWGEARAALMKLKLTSSDARCYELLARLEREEKGDAAASAVWLAMAEEFNVPMWVCKIDGTRHSQFQTICPSCGSFASFRWQNPGQNLPAVIAA